MKATSAVNMVIAQSGGPSMVINQSLVGAVLAARAAKGIGKILGARHGIAGILAGDYVDLRKPSVAKLNAIADTPSSALGSCRLKPSADDCRKIFEAFRRRKVGYFFYIGGNDSADAARIVAEEAEKAGYPLVCYHIPKTIDNDLRSCDHTPGFGSAARFVACALKGDDLDNRALGGVKIDVIMGRDAGFLTAASALARENRGDGPQVRQGRAGRDEEGRPLRGGRLRGHPRRAGRALREEVRGWRAGLPRQPPALGHRRARRLPREAPEVRGGRLARARGHLRLLAALVPGHRLEDGPEGGARRRRRRREGRAEGKTHEGHDRHRAQAGREVRRHVRGAAPVPPP